MNVKSKIILGKIFDYLKRNKSLEIMKCNKKLQNRLNLSINDYKEYSQLYTSIEIELIPDNKEYGTVINIDDKDKEYYHIYFDNLKFENKSNILFKDEKVKKIKIIIDYQALSFKGLFTDCKCVSSICFKKFYRTNIIDMSYMFSGCSSLKELNLSNFHTDNVTDMSYMFSGCSLLNELNISNFNTNNVTNMNSMFSQCSSLKKINLSNFNTNNVTDMGNMFSGCISLEELNISNFNTNNVTDMSRMFYYCSSLKKLNLSNFNTKNVKEKDGMLDGCSDEIKNVIKLKNKSLDSEKAKV